MSIVYDLACLELVKNKLMTTEEVVVDTETTGLDVWKSDRLCGIGFCFPDEQAFYLPYRHYEGISAVPGIMSALDDESVNLPLETLPELLDVLSDVPKLIGHNIKFDLAALSRDGFVIGDGQELEDTIVGARLYFPDKHPDLSLENCCRVLLGSQEGKYKETFEEYLRQNGWQNDYHKGSPERVGEYCKGDTVSTFRLRNRLVEYIESTGQRKIWDQESKLLRVLWKMELAGLFYDREYCKDRIPKIDTRVAEIERLVWEMCGEEFNLGSSDQITEVFTRMGIKAVSYTTGGVSGKPKPKWDVASLMSIEHPACGGILEYRGLQKVKTTYFEPLLEFEDCIVHPTFKSWGTVTGRMSCVAAHTPIECPRDLTKYPNGIPISEIEEGQWVYSFTPKKKFCMRKVVRVWKTAVKPTLRIHLTANLRKSQILEITSDHLVRMHNGTWKYAGDLRVGNKLLSGPRRTGGGKEHYQLRSVLAERSPELDFRFTGKLYEHRYVYCIANGLVQTNCHYHVHHVDENKFNNSPENLEYLPDTEHRAIHNTGATLKDIEAAVNNPLSWKHHYKTFYRVCKRVGVDITDQIIRETRATIRREYLQQEKDRPKKQNHGWKHVNSSPAQFRNSKFYTVSKIELGPTQDVWDMEVEDTRCFIASGVVVHNSTNPNAQNISNKFQSLEGNEASPEAMKAVQAFLGARSGEVVNMEKKGGGTAGGLSLASIMALSDTYVETPNSIAVRRLYIPRPNNRLYFVDFSQMEMRVFADYVGDLELHALLEDPNFDFHTHVAKTVWGVDEKNNLWNFYRTLAKAINFGLIYGIGTKKLAGQIQKTEEEATLYKEEYFKRFPKAKDYMRRVIQQIELTGKISNKFGRLYQLPADKGYVGINFQVQGLSADIVKAAMISVDQMLTGTKAKTRMICQVHDELVFDVTPDEEYQIIPEIKRLAEIRRINTFLPVDVARGNPSWAQKEKVCIKCMGVKTKEHDCTTLQ
jgi:DNA polymerase I-like protein with 3'-5' exonuclease and polymerase domains